MADFALWATAAEEALGLEQGAFIDAYSRNRADASSMALEAEPVAGKVQEFLAKQTPPVWQGKASALLRELNAITGEAEQKQDAWPKQANGLSGALRRVAPNLRKQGVNVQFSRSGSRGRVVTLVGTGTQNSDTIDTIVTPERAKAKLSDDQQAKGDDASDDGVDGTNADQVPFERASDDSDDSDDVAHTYSNADFEDEEDDGFIPF